VKEMGLALAAVICTGEPIKLHIEGEAWETVKYRTLFGARTSGEQEKV
jgi:hypothetical protein